MHKQNQKFKKEIEIIKTNKQTTGILELKILSEPKNH